MGAIPLRHHVAAPWTSGGTLPPRGWRGAECWRESWMGIEKEPVVRGHTSWRKSIDEDVMRDLSEFRMAGDNARLLAGRALIFVQPVVAGWQRELAGLGEDAGAFPAEGAVERARRCAATTATFTASGWFGRWRASFASGAPSRAARAVGVRPAPLRRLPSGDGPRR